MNTPSQPVKGSALRVVVSRALLERQIDVLDCMVELAFLRAQFTPSAKTLQAASE